MKDKTIFYIHGLGSGEGSRTAQAMQEAFPGYRIYAPEIPHAPTEAMIFISNMASALSPCLTVGTSLGGFYAMMLKGRDRLLINPAMYPSEDIRRGVGLGVHSFVKKRRRGETVYTIDEGYLRALSDMERYFFASPTDDSGKIYALFGKNDPLVAHCGDFMKLFGRERIRVCEASHRLSPSELRDDLCPFVKEILEGKA